MKKIILTVAAVLTLGLSFAQECKSVKAEVDSYTGERTIETEFVNPSFGCYIVAKKNYGVILWIQLKSKILLSMDAGEILYFKLSDNSVVKLTVKKYNISDYSSYDGYTNSFGFILDQEVLDALMNKEVIGIKCSVNEYNLSAKESTTLKNNINCIVNTK
jgi:hypothetical protein